MEIETMTDQSLQIHHREQDPRMIHNSLHHVSESLENLREAQTETTAQYPNVTDISGHFTETLHCLHELLTIARYHKEACALTILVSTRVVMMLTVEIIKMQIA